MSKRKAFGNITPNDIAVVRKEDGSVERIECFGALFHRTSAFLEWYWSLGEDHKYSTAIIKKLSGVMDGVTITKEHVHNLYRLSFTLDGAHYSFIVDDIDMKRKDFIHTKFLCSNVLLRNKFHSDEEWKDFLSRCKIDDLDARKEPKYCDVVIRRKKGAICPFAVNHDLIWRGKDRMYFINEMDSNHIRSSLALLLEDVNVYGYREDSTERATYIAAFKAELAKRGDPWHVA